MVKSPQLKQDTMDKVKPNAEQVLSDSNRKPKYGTQAQQSKLLTGKRSSVSGEHGSNVTGTASHHREYRLRKESITSVGSAIVKGTQLLCIRMSDVVVSLLVLLPLTIAMWRGLWNIEEYYLKPIYSIIIGNSLLFVLYYFQEEIKDSFHVRRLSFPAFYFVSRILLLTHSFASITQWRGLWDFLVDSTPVEWEIESITFSFLAGIILLMFFQSFCNVLAIPLFVGVDEATSIHDCQLRYKTSPDLKCLYFLDCFWSTIVIQNLTVASWRGLWGLADLYITPGYPILSATISLGVGGFMTILLCVLQPCFFRSMIKHEGIVRLVISNVVTLIAFTACVLSWRGTWELYDNLIKFDIPLLSEWLTVVIGTVGCMLLGCLSTVSSRGITVDGEDSGDGTSEWPISYISLLQNKRHHGIPFPEPWLFRYLCTSQRMEMAEPLTLRRRSTNPATIQSITKFSGGDLTEDIHASSRLVSNSIFVQELNLQVGEGDRIEYENHIGNTNTNKFKIGHKSING